MNKIEKIEQDTIKRYSNRYKDLGVDVKTLGWGDLDQQKYRFLQVIKNCNLSNKTILDIGCGFGDFYQFLVENSIDIINYTGIDINDDLLNEAKKRFPNRNFLNKNIMRSNIDFSSDVIVMLGVLNFNLKDNFDNYKYAQELIKKAFEVTNRYLIVDFLSSHITSKYPKEDFVFYYEPAKMIQLATSLTSNFKIIHNYNPIPQKEFLLVLEK